MLVCSDEFEGCVDDTGGSECLPNYDPEQLELCLEQHELCTACADSDEGLIACKTVFDACINPPM